MQEPVQGSTSSGSEPSAFEVQTSARSSWWRSNPRREPSRDHSAWRATPPDPVKIGWFSLPSGRTSETPDPSAIEYRIHGSSSASDVETVVRSAGPVVAGLLTTDRSPTDGG